VRLRQSLRRNPGKAKSDIWSNWWVFNNGRRLGSLWLSWASWNSTEPLNSEFNSLNCRCEWHILVTSWPCSDTFSRPKPLNRFFNPFCLLWRRGKLSFVEPKIADSSFRWLQTPMNSLPMSHWFLCVMLFSDLILGAETAMNYE
jgi:hypothetical protein